MKISGWGRYPMIDARVWQPQANTDCFNLVRNFNGLIPRGNGRSYGDSANSTAIIQTTYLGRYIEFDVSNGILNCEAGTSIQEILKLIVPKGWFIPVTPGTSYISVGGAIASDVHGKNHHLSGSFSDHVISFDLMLGTGEIVTVSKTKLTDLFKATCGGMGLTGVILSAVIQLKPIQSSRIIQTTIMANCLEEVCEQFELNSSSTYSVAWIDCLAKGDRMGRSLLMLGEHAQDGILQLAKSRALNIPIELPSVLLNHYSVKAFNAIYYHKAAIKVKEGMLPFEKYFYPLDTISNWNRLYGRAGFIQYQFVLPKAAGVQGLKKLLNTIVASGKGSFLAVLKTFGPGNDNYLSFPAEGYTLALDFKVSPDLIRFTKKLDSMVIDLGGKIYLTKDALMSEITFKSTYPQWEQFENVRAKYGAIGKFSSSQSKRLGLL